MSATNHTNYYNLPQFIGTDIPSWLTDVNGALSAIDSAVHTVHEETVTNAGAIVVVDGRVDNVANDVSTNAGEITGLKGRVTTLETTVGNNSIKIGANPLDTTAQNLSDAVNELNDKITGDSFTYLTFFTDNGTKTLAESLENFKYLFLVGYASGVIYETRLIPRALYSDSSIGNFSMIVCTHVNGKDHKVTFTVNSPTSVTVSARSGLNLRLYGVN